MFRWQRILISVLLACALSAQSQAEPPHQVTFPPFPSQDVWPVFSPRGDKFAFARWPPSSPPLPVILVADAATGAVDTLVSGLPTNWNPNGGLAWSSDGQKIVFYDSDTHAIWTADVPSPPAQPLPHLVAALEGISMGICGTIIAIDDKGTLYVDCGAEGNWEVAGNVPGRPVHLSTGAAPRVILVTMSNGDIYTSAAGNTLPWTFTLHSNVFASAGITGVEAATPPIASNQLANARPNPFNPNTQIPYRLASGGRVQILVFDVNGRLVRTLENTTRQAGQYVARWNGQNDSGEAAASGTYFAKIIYPDGTKADQKITVLR